MRIISWRAHGLERIHVGLPALDKIAKEIGEVVYENFMDGCVALKGEGLQGYVVVGPATISSTTPDLGFCPRRTFLRNDHWLYLDQICMP